MFYANGVKMMLIQLIYIFFIIAALLIQASPRKECAALGFRMCQSLGLGIIFLLDIWASVLYKACAVGGVLVMGVISYMIGEVMQNPVPYGDTEPCGV